MTKKFLKTFFVLIIAILFFTLSVKNISYGMQDCDPVSTCTGSVCPGGSCVCGWDGCTCCYTYNDSDPCADACFGIPNGTVCYCYVGGSRGTCSGGYCSIGRVPTTTICVPNCSGKVCGDDGCGGSCGTCREGYECYGGYMCCPDCGYWGWECGTWKTGCPSCGSCLAGYTCPGGTCLAPTTTTTTAPTTTTTTSAGTTTTTAPTTTTTTSAGTTTTTRATTTTTSSGTTTTSATTHYTCNGATGNCYVNAGGAYTSLTTCNSNCDIHYACNASTGDCDASAGGAYTSLTTCNTNCDPVTTTTTTTTTTIPTTTTTVLTYTVSGQVFVDNNSNGLKDAGESCYQGPVTINVGGSQETFTSATACNTYSYSVSNQCPVVNIVPPIGYTATGWFGTNTVSGSVSGTGASAYICEQ